MVTSKRRKKTGSPKIYTVPSVQDSESSNEDEVLSDVPPPQDAEDVAVETGDFQSMTTRAYKGDRQGTTLHELHLKHVATSREVARIFEIYGRAKIEEVVASGSITSAQKILRLDRDPLDRLKRLMRVLHYYNLPCYDLLSTETCAVVQAVQYCEYLSNIQPTIII
jgi:hypothetical protein